MSAAGDQEDAAGLNFFDAEACANPQPVFEELRKRCPVGRPIPGGSICFARYEDVMYALKHPEIFSSVMPAGIVGNKRPLIPLHVDPPRQVKYRKLLDPLFARRRMLTMEDEYRQLAGQLIDQFADKGECEFDRDFAIPYPCTVFLSLMGLPQADLDLFLELKDGIVRPETLSDEDPGAVRMRTGTRIYAYFEEILAERAKKPQEDMLNFFMEAEVDGERLTHEEIVDICFLFLLGGLDTVTATLGCSVAYLAANPDRRQSLVDDPELIPAAVEELLRWETPVVQVIRLVTQEVTVGGVDLEPGEAVTLILGAADTDDEHFENAQQVDFDRNPNKHLAFGGGPHRCLGSHLARLEMRIALEELLRRIPDFSVKPGEAPRYSQAIREVLYLPLVWETR